MDVDEDMLLRAEQRVGTVLRGKYHLDGVLGVGGMAVVYAATHRNQKRFAVKVLHSELSARREVSARFLREGYAANSVRHPGAVAVLDDDVAEDGAAFLVMELLEGTNLEVLCARAGGRLALRDALCVTHDALDVLAAAHANAVVHRDIKPSNLMLLRDGQLKVLDFGIARVRDASTASQPATRTGSTLGTPAFMAPEQALAQVSDIDAQTDVWAVGATLFTMISGHLVHEGANAQQILVRAATTPARSVADVVSDVPAHVAALVAKALAFDKAGRWSSAAAMRDAVALAHETEFGEALSRRPLAMLSAGLGVAATAVSVAAPPQAAAASQPVDGQLGFATTAVSTGGSSSPARVSPAAITAPVPSRPPAPVAGQRTARSRARVVAPLGVTAALLVLGGTGFFLMRNEGRGDGGSDGIRAAPERGPPRVSSADPTSVPSAAVLGPAPSSPAASPPALVPEARRPDAVSPSPETIPHGAPRSRLAPPASSAPPAAPPSASPRAAVDGGGSRSIASPRNPLDMLLK